MSNPSELRLRRDQIAEFVKSPDSIRILEQLFDKASNAISWTYSDTAPTAPSPGDKWVDPDTMVELTWVNSDIGWHAF